MKPKKSKGNKAQELKTALEILKEKRAYLIGIAFKIAIKIVKKKSEVSSPEVWKKLYARARRSKNFEAILMNADPRWMGVVFNSRNWTRVRWNIDDKGALKASHNRPSSVWRLRDS